MRLWGIPEDTPTPLVPLTNYAEGGSTSSGNDTRGNPNVLQLLRQGAGGDNGSDANPTDQRGPPQNGQEGDIIIAEPGSMIGFAGPRVIRETTHQTLPADFQTAEFLEKRGLIDLIVPRAKMRATLGDLLGYFSAK